MLTRGKLAASILTVGLLAAAPVSAAVQTFATFVPDIVSPANVRYQQTGVNDGRFFTINPSTSDVPGAVPVRFSFVNSALAALGVLDASFSFNARAIDNPALSIGGFLVQNIDLGTFSFTYTGSTPLVVGGVTYTTGANLLTGVFTNANIFGSASGSSGSLFGSTPDGTLVYTSDFLSISPSTNKDFSLALTSITPFLTRLNPDSSIGSFKANATGAFSADISVVPEPQTWFLLAAGFGLVGLRRRRRTIETHVAN